MAEALLVMDMQRVVVDQFGGTSEQIVSVTEAIAHAHQSAITVVFVRVEFRPGYPEVSELNSTFTSLKNSGRFMSGDPQADLIPELDVKDGDIVVTKKRVSAFTGSDLEVVLRAKDIRHLALCGIATSGVVLSTLRQASDLDFACTVLSDACADGDPEVHRVLLTKLFPRQAAVSTVEEWTSRTGQHGG